MTLVRRHQVMVVVLLLAAMLAACAWGPAALPKRSSQARSQARTTSTRPTTAPERPSPGATSTRARGSNIGQEAPDFALPSLNGQEARLSDYRGQIVLLNFWATWCGPCRAEVPELVKVYDRYKERGFTVVAVNLGEPREGVAAFAQDFNMAFPVLLDQDGHTISLYPTRGIPTTFILDRDGVVRNVRVGSMDGEFVAQMVEPLLEE